MRCNGCGVELQTTDPRSPGYIPKEVLERRLKEGKEILCRRCFRAKHYGEYEDIKLKDFLLEYKDVLREFENHILVVDIFDVEGTMREELLKILSDKKVILVLNKVDLLPKYVRKSEILLWIQEKFEGEVFLISARRGHGIASLRRRISADGKAHLILGCTNVGKSSVLKELTESEVTVSPHPGTTLGLIERKLKDSKISVFDTPGLITNDRFVDLLRPACQRKVLPKDEVRRKTFKSKVGKLYFLGGMVIMEPLVEGTMFKIFSSEGVRIHETSMKNFERLIKKSWGRFLIPPCSPGEIKYEDIEWEEIIFELNEGEDLNFTGLGWLNVKKGSMRVKIRKPRGASVFLRDALINPKRKR